MKARFHHFQLVVTLLLLTTSLPTAAQDATAVTAEQLQQALAERDAIIISLLDRVESLELRLAVLDTASAAPANTTTSTADAARPAANRGSDNGGDFAVDELAAERALERGLVQQGVRLLRVGQVQLAPTSSYGRVERSMTIAADGLLSGQQKTETEFSDFSVLGRLGLPFNAQLEINLPYRQVDITRQFSTAEGALDSSDSSGSGFGNVSIGIASRLLQENGWQPELLGRLTWLSGSGEEEDRGVSLGGNYAGFGFDLNASWRRDPMVFLLGAGYFRYDDEGLQPGDAVNLSVGASLAISPETAMTVALSQRFADDFTLDGRALPGTDQVSSLLNISTSTLLGRASLLQLNAGIGLTPDAPDYLFGVSLPFDAGSIAVGGR